MCFYKRFIFYYVYASLILCLAKNGGTEGRKRHSATAGGETARHPGTKRVLAEEILALGRLLLGSSLGRHLCCLLLLLELILLVVRVMTVQYPLCLVLPFHSAQSLEVAQLLQLLLGSGPVGISQHLPPLRALSVEGPGYLGQGPFRVGMGRPDQVHPIAQLAGDQDPGEPAGQALRHGVPLHALHAEGRPVALVDVRARQPGAGHLHPEGGVSALHLEDVADGNVLGGNALDDDLLSEAGIVQNELDGLRGGIGGFSAGVHFYRGTGIGGGGFGTGIGLRLDNGRREKVFRRRGVAHQGLVVVNGLPKDGPLIVYPLIVGRIGMLRQVGVVEGPIPLHHYQTPLRLEQGHVVLRPVGRLGLEPAAERLFRSFPLGRLAHLLLLLLRFRFRFAAAVRFVVGVAVVAAAITVGRVRVGICSRCHVFGIDNVVVVVGIVVVQQRSGVQPLPDHDLIHRAVLEDVVLGQVRLARDAAALVDAQHLHFGGRSGGLGLVAAARVRQLVGAGAADGIVEEAGDAVAVVVGLLLDHVDHAVGIDNDRRPVDGGDAGRHGWLWWWNTVVVYCTEVTVWWEILIRCFGQCNTRTNVWSWFPLSVQIDVLRRRRQSVLRS
mmetsp:Transcript_9313/g.26195  ORF Transcript_9313/g.26195 Transcript_9313/m.26195 type:complete len:610 (+) Transcript_9313:722-2551(+)